jgi:hypothetical protein
LKVGSDLDCSVDDPIPGCASIGVCGPLADNVDDPRGWLVCNGVEPV